MATTITFEVPEDLTPGQAAELANLARQRTYHLAYAKGGLAAELDRSIETQRLVDEGLPDAREGKPVPADLARRWFRAAIFDAVDVLVSLRGAWSNLPFEDRDLGLIDAAAEEWPAIQNHRRQIADVLADPMWPRKTSRSAEIDGYAILAEMFVDGVAINPAHPPKWGVGEQYRGSFDISFWWGRPYIYQEDPDGVYVVACLDGGAWDRPTQWGFAPDIPGAMAILKERLNA